MERVAALVERNSASAHAVRAVAQVERLAQQRYRVLLTTESQGTRGSRTVEERSCQALADVVVLILAWMIQPELSEAAPAAAVRPPPPAKAQPPEPKRARASSPEWNLSLRGTGDLGSLPHPALGGSLTVGYRVRRLQLSLQGSYFPISRGEVPRVAGFAATGGDFSLLAAALLFCLEPTAARVGFCAGPELDHQRAEGFGVSSPRTGQKTWLSFSAGLRSALHLGGRLWLEAAAEAVVPTLREAFVLQGIGTVHRPSAAIARASLGLGLTL